MDDFHAWLLTAAHNSPATAHKRLQRLRFAKRRGFDADAFQRGLTHAHRAGTHYLATRRLELGNSAYGNDVRLLNAYARFHSFDLHWPVPRVDRPRPPEYAAGDLAALRGCQMPTRWMTLRCRAAHQLNLATGLRRGELAALCAADLDTEGYTVRVTTKHGRPRRLAWADPRIMQDTALRTWWDATEPQERLFPVNAEVLANRHWFWGRAGGVAASFQRGRRTFGRTLKRQGVPAETIQVYLGHAKVDTTLIYLDMQDESASADMGRHGVRLAW